MKSGVDEREDDGNYSLRSDESGTAENDITSRSLDPNDYSEQLINSVINEIVEYRCRIRRNNQQCSSCNRFHAEQPRFGIDDMDRLDDFKNASKSRQSVNEIVGILQLINEGETDIIALENPILERWINESKNHEMVLSIYSVNSCEPNQILYGSLGCILHAASNHLSDESAELIVSSLKTHLIDRIDEFGDNHMKHFMNCILQLTNEITNSERKIWRDKLNQLIHLDLVKFLLRETLVLNNLSMRRIA